ncbi:MAG: nuclear transport factor 2 family protein [Acidobacteriota bacterium]
MKTIFRLTISIVAVLFFTYTGIIGNSSIYAAPQAGHPKEIEKLFAPWNSLDPDKVAACFTEDGVYEDVTAGHISRGLAEVRKWDAGGFEVVKNFKLEIGSVRNFV